jgi:Flp pilus assembly protein TadG
MSRLGRGWPQLRPDDEGQVLLLTLVYTLIAFSLIIVVVDVTAVHLARTQLLDAADAAALDAADGIDVPATYGAADSPEAASSDGQHLVVTDTTVRQQAEAYLATYEPPSRLDEVAVAAGTGSRDGLSATVALTGRVRLPIAGAVVDGWSDGIVVTVTSTALAPVSADVVP